MTSRNFVAVVSASLLCGWLSFQVAAAAEPEAAQAPAATAPAADAAAQAVMPATSTASSPAAAVQSAPAAAAAAPNAASAAAPAAAAAAAQPAATGDDQVICKTTEVFGSRVRKTKICRTKKEWQMEAQAAKDYTKGINKGSSPGPGGEALPVGG